MWWLILSLRRACGVVWCGVAQGGSVERMVSDMLFKGSLVHVASFYGAHDSLRYLLSDRASAALTAFYSAPTLDTEVCVCVFP